MKRLPNLSGLSTAEKLYKESVLGPVGPPQNLTPDMKVRYVPVTSEEILGKLAEFVKTSTPSIVASAFGRYASYLGYGDESHDLEEGTKLSIETTLQEVQLCMEELQMPTAGMRSTNDLSMHESDDEEPKPPRFRPLRSEPNLLMQQQEAYFEEQKFLKTQALSRIQLRLVNAFLSMFKAIALVLGPVAATRLLMTTLANPTAPSNVFMLA